jgi:capsular polysaccharide biosynthesis protein
MKESIQITPLYNEEVMDVLCKKLENGEAIKIPNELADQIRKNIRKRFCSVDHNHVEYLSSEGKKFTTFSHFKYV